MTESELITVFWVFFIDSREKGREGKEKKIFFLFLLIPERGEGKEKEGEKHPSIVYCMCTDWGPNAAGHRMQLGMCPNQESNG